MSMCAYRLEWPILNRSTVLALSASVTLAACGGGGSGDTVEPPTPLPPAPVNTAPEFAGQFDATVNENEAITVDIVATDADGDGLTLAIEGPDAAVIQFDAQASSVSIGPLDFENPQDADGNNVYAFTVTASDSEATTSQNFSLTVLNISDNAPEFSGAFDASADEGTSTSIVFGVVDADGDQFALTLTGPDAALFDLDDATFTVGANQSFDFEAPTDANGDNVYEFAVTADDGEATTSQEFTLTVLNISDNAPQFSGAFDVTADEGETASIVVAVADADGDVVALTLAGPDAALFELDNATSTVGTNQTFDFEAPADANGDNVYEFQVTASDPVNSTTQAFTLTIENIIDTFTAVELLDPNPAAGNSFGGAVSVLTNGNLAVGVRRDSTLAFENGAVHLYDPTTGELLGSFFGAETDQEAGFALIPLRNGNLLARSGAFGRFEGRASAASVSLLSGEDLTEIQTLGGDDANDRFGSNSNGIVELQGPNEGRFVIGTSSDGLDNLSSHGSVVLVDGVTGATINRIDGDSPQDFLSGTGVAALSNGNYVIRSGSDVVNGFARAGSVILMDGASGEEIARFEGNTGSQFVGDRFDVLPNGNFIVGIRNDSGVVAEDGSVVLIDGATGDLITQIRGSDVGATRLGNDLLALENGNFVVGASGSDSNGLTNNGFVGLFDGTGAFISSVVGDNNDDDIGQQLFALEDGQFFTLSPEDDVEGQVDVGSAIFFDSAGNELARITGEIAGDALGLDEFLDQPAIVLANGNVVLAVESATINGVPFVGRVILVDGTNFTEIERFDFDNDSDLGDGGKLAPLPNGNFVLLASGDDVNGVENVGSLKLVDGTSGEIILDLAGPSEFAFDANEITILPNDHFVLSTNDETVDGISRVGVVRVINATSGEIVQTFEGDQANDQFGSRIVALGDGGFLIGNNDDDNNGLENSGSVFLITAQ